MVNLYIVQDLMMIQSTSKKWSCNKKQLRKERKRSHLEATAVTEAITIIIVDTDII
uniref:Uncharacterized protein n=1 Tax=Tetranychus urticae TaxID=32264 RepID=T1KZ45_TETUR